MLIAATRASSAAIFACSAHHQPAWWASALQALSLNSKPQNGLLCVITTTGVCSLLPQAAFQAVKPLLTMRSSPFDSSFLFTVWEHQGPVCVLSFVFVILCRMLPCWPHPAGSEVHWCSAEPAPPAGSVPSWLLKPMGCASRSWLCNVDHLQRRAAIAGHAGGHAPPQLRKQLPAQQGAIAAMAASRCSQQAACSQTQAVCSNPAFHTASQQPPFVPQVGQGSGCGPPGDGAASCS